MGSFPSAVSTFSPSVAYSPTSLDPRTTCPFAWPGCFLFPPPLPLPMFSNLPNLQFVETFPGLFPFATVSPLSFQKPLSNILNVDPGPLFPFFFHTPTFPSLIVVSLPFEGVFLPPVHHSFSPFPSLFSPPPLVSFSPVPFHQRRIIRFFSSFCAYFPSLQDKCVPRKCCPWDSPSFLLDPAPSVFALFPFSTVLSLFLTVEDWFRCPFAQCLTIGTANWKISGKQSA